MLYALVDDKRTTPQKDQDAVCPCCRKEVIARCGSLNIHHWAHTANSECPGAGPETDWHRFWKCRFPAENIEVEYRGRYANAAHCGKVYEFQCSPISVPDITAREHHFDGAVVWVIDGRNKKIMLEEKTSKRSGYKYFAFAWLWPWRSFWVATCPVYIDLGERRLLYVAGFNDGRNSGWGDIIPYEGLLSHRAYRHPEKRIEVSEINGKQRVQCMLPVRGWHRSYYSRALAAARSPAESHWRRLEPQFLSKTNVLKITFKTGACL